MRPNIYSFILAIITVIVAPFSMVFAGELTGLVAIDSRFFLKAPTFAGQDMNNGPTLVVEPEYYHVSSDDKHIFTLRPFLRIDPYDDKRQHFDVRQLDWVYAESDFEIRAGIGKVFWGVTESNHLVDIINQDDALEDSDGEDKLGQPMIQFGLFKDWGNLRLFYLPYFRERNFSGVTGRLRGEKPIESDLATYDSASEEWNPDFAIRYNNTIGDWDIGLAHFSGTSREPVLVSATNLDGDNILIPHYDIIDQTSLDLQYTKEGWLWKLEAMTRSGHGRRFAAVTAGLEYTFYSMFDSDADLGVLTEYQFDDRSSDAPDVFADDDIFAGFRLTFNDVYDSEMLAGISVDLNNESTFMVMEASRRIGNNWKIELDARIFTNIDTDAPASFLRNDDHIQLRLARYF